MITLDPRGVISKIQFADDKHLLFGAHASSRCFPFYLLNHVAGIPAEFEISMMRILRIVLALLTLAGSLIACEPKDPPPSLGNPSNVSALNTTSQPTSSNGQSADLGGRWEILPGKPIVSPNGDDGWKTVRIEISLENKTSHFSSPNIKTAGAALFTDIDHSYPVETYMMSGALKSTAQVISFSGKLPPGFRVRGEYRSDAVASYCFESRIPNGANPVRIRIPGYSGDINLGDPSPTDFPGGADYHPQKSGNQIDVAGKARLSMDSFAIKNAWPITHELISARVTLINREDGGDTTLNLQALPIGDDGIIGAPYYDPPDCERMPTLGPSLSKVAQICGLLPRGTKKVRIIITGDVNEVYDSGQ